MAAFLAPTVIHIEQRETVKLSHRVPQRSHFCSKFRRRAIMQMYGAPRSRDEEEIQKNADETHEHSGGTSQFKFDQSSDKNAFGRDPKKETEFWMGHAREVLESNEVKEAVEEHKDKGGDGLTDEQRAYKEFIASMDRDKEKKKEANERQELE